MSANEWERLTKTINKARKELDEAESASPDEQKDPFSAIVAIRRNIQFD
jgi:hypothetical protein